jgi:tRNA dimethylallyltransferase
MIALAGPTAVGKSEVALCLAEMIGGQIISVDSMQVYRGLDIGTAKPSAGQRTHIRHHLIDVVGLSEGFDAARFARLAGEAVADIRSRGRVPILCGGTGLYFQAFLEGLGEAPPGDVVLRAELEARPLDELLKDLAKRDPAAYETIDRQNFRRVIRALEIVTLTGQPLAAQRAKWPQNDPTSGDRAAGTMVLLTRDPADLRQRIDQRVDKMFRLGLVAETEALLRQGLTENRTAGQAIGYRQVIEHLRGERDLPQTIELVKIKTRQFAKRQMTWFRKYGSAKTVDVALDESPGQTTARVLAEVPKF